MTLAHFRAAVAEAFARAAGSAGTVRRRVRIAGDAVEIRFAGEALVPLLFPSLSHLEEEAGPAPALAIDVWDAASTGEPLPAPAAAAPRALWREEPLHLLAEPATFSLVDVARGRAACAYGSAADVPPWDVAAPFRFLLSSWFAGRGMQLVHAAAVGTRDGAALLTAPGGSGKSATALGCLAAGLSYLGDDFVLLGAPPDPPLFSLYSVAKLDPEFLSSRLPRIPARVLGADPHRGGKLLLGLPPGPLLPREAPLRAILVPRVAGATRLRAIRPIDALRAMAPTTAIFLPGSGAASLARMAALVRAVPCHALDLGDDPAEVAGAVSGLLGSTCALA